MTKKGCPVITNIEREYNDHVYNIWEDLSDITQDSPKLNQEQEHTNNNVSLQVIQFMKDKLESLEIKTS